MTYNALAALHETQCSIIYNALDSRNPKKALIECDKLLSTTTFPLVLALKSISLSRLNRKQEAESICNQILSILESNSKSNNPQIQLLGLDHSSLLALDITLQDLARGQEMSTLLENATKLQPGNEAIWSKYFKRLISERQWMKAQQISLKMSKQFTNPQSSCKYFWHSIQSYVLLYTFSPSSPGSKLALPLSSRMISTQLKLPNFSLDSNSDQILHLYCSVLMKQGSWKEVLDLLDSENSKIIRKRDMGLEILRGETLVKLEMWGRIWEEGREKVKNGDRNWATLLSLVSSSIKLFKTSNSSTQIKETTTPLSTLLKKTPLDRSLRLAQLELSKLIRISNLTSHFQVLDLDLLELSLRFFKDLSEKSCCFEDLKPYVDELSTQERGNFTSNLTFEKKDEGSDFKDLKELSIYINQEKFKRYLEEKTDEEGEIEDGKRLLKSYLKGLKLGSNLPLTEMQPADDLALLASHALISASYLSKSNKFQHLLEALSLLKFANIKSPKGYQLRILSVRIFKLLGCFKSALKEYNEIGVKAIQLDTLSHIVADRIEIFPASGKDKEIEGEGEERKNGRKGKGKGKDKDKDKDEESENALEIIQDSEKIYESNQEETPAIISRAFDLGTYSRIEEFVDFHSRLDLSINRQLLRLSKARIHLRRYMETQSSSEIDKVKVEVEKVNEAMKLGAPSDQRDFSVVPSYQSKSTSLRSIDELTSISKRTGVDWIYFVLQLLGLYCGVEVSAPDPISIDKLSAVELSFLNIIKLLASRGEGAKISEEQKALIVSFFLDRKDSIESSGAEVLPWEILHEHQIALEAYSLLSTLSIRDSEHQDGPLFTIMSTCLPMFESIISHLLSRSKAISSKQSKDELLQNIDDSSSWISVADEQVKEIFKDLVNRVGDEYSEALADSVGSVELSSLSQVE